MHGQGGARVFARVAKGLETHSFELRLLPRT